MLKLAKVFKTIPQDKLKKYCCLLKKMPNIVKTTLNVNDKIMSYAKIFYKKKNMFFIGRGLDYCLAQESSLKLKELSYIHSEAYAAGELKHGTISLIEKNTPVIALATQKHLFTKTINNIEEVRARGANVFLIYTNGEKVDETLFPISIKLQKIDDIFSPLCSIIPMQLFAYNIAVLKGCDVDKPRNLAKSVTVE